MTAPYDGAAARWASGASIVYRPLAQDLVRRAPHPLAGRLVLDAGAGTGAVSEVLVSSGARPIAVDLSGDMLRWDRDRRPPSAVAEVGRLPVATGGVDDAIASFVLNHLRRPAFAMHELARTIAPGGALLATAFGDDSDTTVRDRIDDVARAHGWVPPPWYVTMKADAAPLLGTAAAMRGVALEAGSFRSIDVDEAAIDVGVTRAEDLVDHRFGQAHVSSWLTTFDAATAAAIREEAVAAAAPVMVPYRPTVVALVAIVGG